MNKYLASYIAIVIAMTALDVLWLSVLAKPLYRDGIGH